MNATMPPSKCLPQLIESLATSEPTRIAIELVGGGSLNFQELDELGKQWALAFEKHSVTAKSPVMSMLPPSFDVVGVWLGLGWLRAVMVATNVEYKGVLLASAIELARPEIILVTKDSVDEVLSCLHERAASSPSQVTVVVVSTDSIPTQILKSGGDNVRVISSREFVSAAKPSSLSPWPGPDPSDVATILFTSGTTGPSKGVIVYWQQVHDMACNLGPIDAFDKDDVFYAPYPWHHASAMFAVYLMALCRGRVVLRERFSASQFLQDIRRYGCTTTLLLGAMSSFVVLQPEAPNDNDSPLDKVLAVPLMTNPAAFAKRFGVKLRTYYSMTEVSGPITSIGYELANETSCGRIHAGYSARIVDNRDVEVAVGEVGELVVRSDVPWSTMGGYWRNPDATVEAWRNLWFHTGDLFRVDDDGNFYFVDRLTDSIRRRGENVSSWELETHVAAQAGVSECAAVAWPSIHGEDEIRLFVVATDGKFDIEQFRLSLVTQLPRHMIPDIIDVVAEFPRTPTGKIRKDVLRKTPIGANTRRWSR